MRQILAQHGAVQRADCGDIQRRRLFEQRLHLRAVFAHDADIVAPGLIIPGLIHIQRAKLAEGVGGVENLIYRIIGNNYLGPVHHGRSDKGQRMLAQGQDIALAYDDAALGVILAVELAHHSKRLGAGYHARGGIARHKDVDVGRVIGLHVLHYQIIGCAAG